MKEDDKKINHEVDLALFDVRISILEKELEEVQESRREYINRNNLNKGQQL